MNRTLMVMAGGTGGHVYPALAVADALRARGWDVFWLGTKNGLEARVVPVAGIDMVWMSMGGMRGKGLLRKLLLPLMLLIAFVQSLRAILLRRPDVVLGMGGYTAFPGGMMASLLNKPLVIHEQNSVGGLTNRVLACLADRVLTAFPLAFQGEKDQPIPCRNVATEWVGNPVRADIAAGKPAPFAGRTGDCACWWWRQPGRRGVERTGAASPGTASAGTAPARRASIRRQHHQTCVRTTLQPGSRPRCATTSRTGPPLTKPATSPFAVPVR